MKMKQRRLYIYPTYQTRSSNSLYALLHANGPPKLVSHAEHERFAAMCLYVAHRA